MRELNSKTAPKTVRPERIIQFGEGNFLRAFVDWIISNMNERSDFNGRVGVVQPIDIIQTTKGGRKLPSPKRMIFSRLTVLGALLLFN